MTKEQLVSRLRMLAAGHPSADCTFTAAAVEIEALQARVAELEDELGSSTAYTLNELQAKICGLAGERDRLAAELAAALPYGPRPKFGTIGSRDVDVAEAQRAWDKAMAAQPAQQVPTTNHVQPVPDHCDRITWRNRYYHLPLAAELSAARAQEPLTDATKASCALGYEECSHRCGTPHVCCDHYVEPEPIATPIPPAQVPAGSIRLWDAQWVSIVNHDNAYNGWSTNDAVNHAVRMTERYIASNVAQNKLPPLPAAQEVK